MSENDMKRRDFILSRSREDELVATGHKRYYVLDAS
jgi:hypothetical protein